MRKQFLTLTIIALNCVILAQTKDAYETNDSSKAGILDPAHFSMHNSVSFGMASSSGSSGLQSQSLYSTMLKYQFNAPVTVRLNFGLPIHSTISSAQNLTRDNIESLEYFKNMPISASLTWQPTPKMLFSLNFAKNVYSNYFFDDYYQENNPGWYHRPSPFIDRVVPEKK